MALLREGRGREAKEFFQRCVDITPEMALNVIKAARERNVDCIVAPYEADAELAFLATSGMADVVVTEDSDLTLFGCPKVLFKLLDTGDGVLYEKENLGKVFGVQADQFSFEKFRYMCITSGCDYIASLPGIGLGKAKNFWQKVSNPDVRTVLRKLPVYLKMPQLIVTQDYIERFLKANNTFLYQLVYDPQARCERPVTEYPESLRGSLDTLLYCGSYSDPETARQMALGNVNIHTLKQVDQYDPDTRQLVQRSRWGDRATHVSIWSRDFWSQKKERRERTEVTRSQPLWRTEVSRAPSTVSKSKGVEKRKSEVTEEEVESLLDEPEEEEEEEETKKVKSPPRKKTKLSELSKFQKVVGLSENTSIKVSKFFGSKKNHENKSLENDEAVETVGGQVKGRRMADSQSGSWFKKIDQPTSADGKFIYSTEQEVRREEIILKEISNSLEDTPENIMRRQRRNPFAVKVPSMRLGEKLEEEGEEMEKEEVKKEEGEEEVKREEAPLVISRSQLSLYSIDGESLTFSQSPSNTQPLSSSPELEPVSSQSPPASGSAPRLGLSRTSAPRGSASSSSVKPTGPAVVRKSSSGGAGPRLGLSRGGGRAGGKQQTLLQMFGKTSVRAQIGPNKH